jgi:hypothetical protein
MHIDSEVRRHLGLEFNPDASSVTAALVRSAGMDPLPVSLPRAIDEWLGRLANLLGGLESADMSKPAAAEVIEEAMETAHAWSAPVLLAVIAPHQSVPKCSARDLPHACKTEMRRLLPEFCARVLRQ